MDFKGTWIAPFVLLFVFVLPACPAKNATLPDELYGTWTSGARKYAGRSFALTEDRTLVLGTGEGVDTYPISWVEEHKGGPEVFYNVHYLDPEGRECSFAFIYAPGDDTTIRLRNQKRIVWRKERQ